MHQAVGGDAHIAPHTVPQPGRCVHRPLRSTIATLRTTPGLRDTLVLWTTPALRGHPSREGIWGFP